MAKQADGALLMVDSGIFRVYYGNVRKIPTPTKGDVAYATDGQTPNSAFILTFENGDFSTLHLKYSKGNEPVEKNYSCIVSFAR
jgi:hypothetical protein